MAILISSIFGMGIFAFIVVALSSLSSEGLFARPFCLRNDCLQTFTSATKQAFLIFRGTIELCVALSTVGGIFVALLNYINSSNSSALIGHIEHLKVFREYLNAEINSRDRLSVQAFDSLRLYELIFDQSHSGKTSVSEEYKKFVVELNGLIERSNSLSISGGRGGFNYRDHQRAIKTHMRYAGVMTEIAPRNDYFEMESQLFSLLQRLNQSFCRPGEVAKIIDAKYS